MLENIYIIDYYLDSRYKHAIILELKVITTKKGAVLIATTKVEL